jgi:type II secretory pathway component PulF
MEENSQPMADSETSEASSSVEGKDIKDLKDKKEIKEKKESFKSFKSFISSLTKKKKESAAPQKESSFSSFLKSINNIGMGKQAHLYVQSVATMLDAGLPLLDSLKTFQMETKNRTTKKVITNIVYDIENGSAFWKAMADRHLFTPYDIAMVQIGEEAGNLA